VKREMRRRRRSVRRQVADNTPPAKEMERTFFHVPAVEPSQLPKSILLKPATDGEAHLPLHSDRESELLRASPPFGDPLIIMAIWHHTDTGDRRGWRKEVSRRCTARPGHTVSMVGDGAAPPLAPAERESSSRSLADRQQRKEGQCHAC